MSIRTKILLLLLFFVSGGTAAVITAYVQERLDANVKPADLYAVVNGQLADIRRDNFPAAYEYASADIQQRFTVAQFATMVRHDFPDLAQSGVAEYGPVEARSGHAQLRVYLVERNGLVMPCLYELVREGSQWRIEGAQVLQPWPATSRMAGTLL